MLSALLNSYWFKLPASATEFDPELDMAWHSLFWAEGTGFVAQGYSDTDSVTTWPNETGESDATEATNRPTYDASHASYNSQPVVNWSSSLTKLMTSEFTSNPTYPISIVVIGNMGSTGSNLVIVDGRTTDPLTRNVIQNQDGSGWQIFSGSTVQFGGTKDTSPHLFVASLDGSTGNDSLTVDGTTVISGVNAGSAQIDGLTLGNYPAAGYSFAGNAALFGIYEGDITQDPNYANFLLWASRHYGLNVSPYMAGGVVT